MAKKMFLSRISRVMIAVASLATLTGFAAHAAPFALGADVSWLPQMEAAGNKFYKAAGGPAGDCLQILKDFGINSIRLRTWVNPSTNAVNGHCSKNETVAMAMRARAMGFRIMIDFHYSDSWADPGKQNKPAAWSSHTINQLVADVDTYTVDVLSTLKDSGVHPEWVEVGNETNNGMLWPDGQCSGSGAGGFKNYSRLIDTAYAAVKSVDTAIKVIVHISNGYNNSLFRWMFDSLKKYNTKYDIIGMSFYPSISGNPAPIKPWKAADSQCLYNMKDMIARYGKPVMIPEIGDSARLAQLSDSMLTDMIAKVASVNGLGVFYWEPEVYGSFTGYPMGAWNSNGTPTVAMNAFLTATATLPASAAKSAAHGTAWIMVPATDLVKIPAGYAGKPFAISAYNLSGTLVRKSSFSRASSISVSKDLRLPRGAYLLRLASPLSKE